MDADLAELWPHEEKQDPSCVKLANCPVACTSKLLSDIATSIMEAKYNAVSIAMKLVLPLLTILKVVGAGVGMSDEQFTTVKNMVW